MANLTENVALDREWVMLIEEAKEIGMTLEEIREFFQVGRVNGNIK
ncbi:anti-repressor SinI family protein [Oceanobacillus piezotolerans]|nr:anti-repressor SinI family protein [Oceanobacillus piezotolerans]